MTTDPLIAFVRARLNEDAAVARAAWPSPWHTAPAGAPWAGPDGADKEAVWGRTYARVARTWTPEGEADTENAAHIARHDPARVLREVEAKRALLKLHARVPGDVPFCVTCDAPTGIPGRPDGCTTMRLLALPYTDHPDYREEWRSMTADGADTFDLISAEEERLAAKETTRGQVPVMHTMVFTTEEPVQALMELETAGAMPIPAVGETIHLHNSQVIVTDVGTIYGRDEVDGRPIVFTSVRCRLAS